MNNNIDVALVDDHALLRNGLAALVNNLGYSVKLECSNGKQLMEKLDKKNLPDLILMDINMPEMDGYETTLWLKNNYPLISVLALSMYDDENAIIRMIKNGAKGFILKDTNPQELKEAIESVIKKGFYYSDLVSGRLVRNIRDQDTDDKNSSKLLLTLNDKEIEFLKLACTEMTYKEIAQQMHLSPRTIDGYRDQLFEKLNIKSRVGLVMFAIKNGIVHCN
jgi:DNA-binding NarL/FixJ family response regulator